MRLIAQLKPGYPWRNVTKPGTAPTFRNRETGEVVRVSEEPGGRYRALQVRGRSKDLLATAASQAEMRRRLEKYMGTDFLSGGL